MSVQPRPVDTVTKENLFIGMPIVLFERLQSNGTYDVPRNLGIADSAEIQKVVNVAQLRNTSSGISVLERELVRQLEPSLVLGIFDFEPENMRLFMSAKDLLSVGSGSVSVTDDEYIVPESPDEFGVLSNRDINTEPLTALTYEEIADEAVGTGDGTTGSASGDFSLDRTVALFSDVSALTVGGVPFTPIATGAAAAGNEVEVEDGATSVSGDLQFFVAGVAADVTGDIVATYLPTHSMANLSDYVLDPSEGRMRMLYDVGDSAEFKVGAAQRLLADYSYTEIDSFKMDPFSQSSFEGRATIQQLTDVGINFIWTIPSVSIRVNDDAFTWNAEDFAVGSLTMNLLSNPSTPNAPFGTLQQYPETP